MSSDRWRLFCAIEIPPDVRRRIASHARRLQELFPDVRASWTREENLHLTIKFIGEVETSRATLLSEATAEAAASIDPFDIILEKPGAFPRRVLWVGVSDPSSNLANLQKKLENECAKQGFGKEDRPFHPHLTLARLRAPYGTQELTATHKTMPFEPALVSVEDLLLIRSDLSSKGSKYTIISRRALKRQ
jgi:RNA 2',3'-cyclic 3'-phosphodiesterase